jgi:glycosyltransferase involved in cell wall biosynthesis
LNELISIIIPIYNLEEYIDDGLSSIVKQSYPNIEILLIDDGSRDESFSKCISWQKRDSRIKAIRQYHQGVSAARNLGIKISKGKYLAFVDGDDTIAENYIKTLYEKTVCMGHDIVFCGIKEIQFPDRKEINHLSSRDCSGLLRNDFRELYTGPMHLSIGTPVCKLFKKSVITKNGLSFKEGLKNREDALFVFSYLHYCKTYAATNLTYYNYHRHNRGSATEKFDYSRIDSDIVYLNFLRTWLIDESIPYADDILGAEIVGSVRSLAIVISKKSFRIYYRTMNIIFNRIRENVRLPKNVTYLKHKIMLNLMSSRIYCLIGVYYWIKFCINI